MASTALATGVARKSGPSTLLRTCLPDKELAVVGNRFNVQIIRRSGAMNGGTKIGQTNSSDFGKRNLEGRTWFQRFQFLHNPLDQRKVFSVSAGFQIGDVDLPVLRDKLLILGFLFN